MTRKCGELTLGRVDPSSKEKTKKIKKNLLELLKLAPSPVIQERRLVG